MSNQPTNETTLAVEGMTCGSCVRHVTDALEAVDGVCQVDVRMREGKVVVRLDGDPGTGRLVDALREAGYESKVA